MTKVIDILMQVWNDKYTAWKEIPDVLNDTTVTVQGTEFENVPKNKREAREELDMVVDAIVILKTARR